MNSKSTCPLCLGKSGGSCTLYPASHAVHCDHCGTYVTTPELFYEIQHGRECPGLWELTQVQRAVLSHRVHKQSSDPENSDSGTFVVTPAVLDSLRSSENLYDPVAQATDLIRYIGDYVSKTGASIRQISGADVQREIGAPSEELAAHIVRELHGDGLVAMQDVSTLRDKEFNAVNLSLEGWRRYAAEKRGRSAGNYGFMAMQFFKSDTDDRHRLNELVKSVVKPTVKAATGCDLVDMRDVGRAGIIDNIMRIKIRDCKFVICDLTHDNNGAYWEAGYAEGLGKPVIYVCEREKFDAKKTHFDTNHCTTIPWSAKDADGFARELSATLRRSLEDSP